LAKNAARPVSEKENRRDVLSLATIMNLRTPDLVWELKQGYDLQEALYCNYVYFNENN
jgi:hypothetical protein